MLKKSDLNEIKAKMEAGTNFKMIMENDYPDEDFNAARDIMIKTFGRQELMKINRANVRKQEFDRMDLEQLNKRIEQVQLTLNNLIEMRDKKINEGI